MEEKITFGDRVKTLRKEKRLTQKQVALDLGLGQSAIANYEQGTRFPDEKTLKAITEYFDTSLDYLLAIERVKPLLKSNLDIREISVTYQNYMLNSFFSDALELLVNSTNQGVSLTVIFREVFIPFLKKMGDLWESTQIDVTKEHLLAEEIERTIGILTYKKSQSVIKKTRCVCTTAGQEMHRITIRMISELLKSEGYPTWFLGLSSPTGDLVKLCKSEKIDLLILSATLNSTIDSINNLIDGIRLDNDLKEMKIIVGGPAYERGDRVLDKTKADYILNDFNTLMEVIKRDFS